MRLKPSTTPTTFAAALTYRHRHPASTSRQGGSVLAISLLMLLVLTVLGISAMDTTVMENRMAANSVQRQLAHQAAEAALREAEAWLSDDANINISAQLESKFNGAQLYNAVDSAKALTWDRYNSKDWTAANSKGVASLSSFAAYVNDIPGAPRYVIEYMGRLGRKHAALNYKDIDARQHAFRVTAIGWGLDKKTKVVLTSTFRKRLP